MIYTLQDHAATLNRTNRINAYHEEEEITTGLNAARTAINDLRKNTTKEVEE